MKNSIGGKIDVEQLASDSREFHSMSDFVNAIRRTRKVMSWGANSWRNHKNYVLRFSVNGHHHKGYVFIVVNFLDLFDVYYTTTKGKIKDISQNVYLDDIIDVIDAKVEYIPEYKDN